MSWGMLQALPGVPLFQAVSGCLRWQEAEVPCTVSEDDRMQLPGAVSAAAGG